MKNKRKRKFFPFYIPMPPLIPQPWDLLPSWKPLKEAAVFLNKKESSS